MCDTTNVIWFAVLCQAWQGSETHNAKAEKHGAEHYEHVVSDAVDHLLKPMRVLVEEHERNCQYKADEGGVDCISCENQSHSNLWLVARVEDLGERG